MRNDHQLTIGKSNPSWGLVSQVIIYKKIQTALNGHRKININAY